MTMTAVSYCFPLLILQYVCTGQEEHSSESIADYVGFITLGSLLSTAGLRSSIDVL